MSNTSDHIKVYAEYTDREGVAQKRLLGVAPEKNLDYWHAAGILNRLAETHIETYRANK